MFMKRVNMHIKNRVPLLLFIAYSASAQDNYAINLKVGDTYTLTFDCYQKIEDHTEPGKKVSFPCLWKFDDCSEENIVQLSEETYKDSTLRVYDPRDGNRRYSFTNVVGSILLMPTLIGFFTLTPYRQEYLFHAINEGTTRLTFICEQRYSWLPPIRTVTVDFSVDTAQEKSRASKFFSSLVKSKNLYIR